MKQKKSQGELQLSKNPKLEEIVSAFVKLSLEIGETVDLEYLKKQRIRIEIIARNHALKTALQYYGKNGGVDVDYLRRVVFANWLDKHAFTERFEPLSWIAI